MPLKHSLRHLKETLRAPFAWQGRYVMCIMGRLPFTVLSEMGGASAIKVANCGRRGSSQFRVWKWLHHCRGDEHETYWDLWEFYEILSLNVLHSFEQQLAVEFLLQLSRVVCTKKVAQAPHRRDIKYLGFYLRCTQIGKEHESSRNKHGIALM